MQGQEHVDLAHSVAHKKTQSNFVSCWFQRWGLHKDYKSEIWHVSQNSTLQNQSHVVSACLDRVYQLTLCVTYDSRSGKINCHEGLHAGSAFFSDHVSDSLTVEYPTTPGFPVPGCNMIIISISSILVCPLILLKMWSIMAMLLTHRRHNQTASQTFNNQSLPHCQAVSPGAGKCDSFGTSMLFLFWWTSNP